MVLYVNCTYSMLLFELPFLDSQYSATLYPQTVIQYLICDRIRELYNSFLMSSGSTYLNLFKTPVILEHLFAILFTCFFQVRFVYRVNPRKCNSSTCSMFILSILRVRVCISFLGT